MVPIPGTTKLHRLEENNGTANVHLSSEDMKEIEEAAAKIQLQGDRYPDGLKKMTDKQFKEKKSGASIPVFGDGPGSHREGLPAERAPPSLLRSLAR